MGTLGSLLLFNRVSGSAQMIKIFPTNICCNILNHIVIMGLFSGFTMVDCYQDSVQFKACVCYFSLFSKDKCISFLVRTKYIKKKFTLQLFFLPTVSQTFILSWATTLYPPPGNFLFRKNNCMCN